jgi:16S rRNA (cytosine1402-N4)-methyltransferase
VGVDRDETAVVVARDVLKTVPCSVSIINSRFGSLREVLADIGPGRIDGIYFDLGISSHQIDSAERGFSYLHNGPLDMRMDKNDVLTAETVINDYPEEKLTDIFRRFGEEKRARRIAREIIRHRADDRIMTTGDLRAFLETILPRKNIKDSLSRLFQAIRIEVNGELDELSAMLPEAFDILIPGGRMVGISYHSLEDRMVKRFFAEKARGCICPDKIPVCQCGQKPQAEILTKRLVRPSASEVAQNKRSRSARLRAAARLKGEV